MDQTVTSFMIGISRLTLWLNEIMVSVATTPGISWMRLLSRSIRCSLSRAKSFTSNV